MTALGSVTKCQKRDTRSDDNVLTAVINKVTDGGPCAHGCGMTPALTNTSPISEKKHQRLGVAATWLLHPNLCLLSVRVYWNNVLQPQRQRPLLSMARYLLTCVLRELPLASYGRHFRSFGTLSLFRLLHRSTPELIPVMPFIAQEFVDVGSRETLLRHFRV